LDHSAGVGECGENKPSPPLFPHYNNSNISSRRGRKKGVWVEKRGGGLPPVAKNFFCEFLICPDSKKIAA